MKKINLLFLLSSIIILFSACSTIKDGFESQRKNSTDEFLVEKKAPLIMPPDFDKLPTPSDADVTNDKFKDSIIIKKNQILIVDDNKNLKKTTKDFILEKIKK